MLLLATGVLEADIVAFLFIGFASLTGLFLAPKQSTY
jgi:hypothetical protein